MTDFWVSGAKYWCSDCKKFIADNKSSRKNHENALEHKANRQARINEMGRKDTSQEKEHDDVRSEIARLAREAEEVMGKEEQQHKLTIIQNLPRGQGPTFDEEAAIRQQEAFIARERSKFMQQHGVKQEQEVDVKQQDVKREVKREMKSEETDMETDAEKERKLEIGRLRAQRDQEQALAAKETAGVMGKWEVVEEPSDVGYYNEFYRQSGTDDQKDTATKEPPKKRQKLANPDDLDEDDNVLSAAALESMQGPHQAEKKPDTFQMQKLNRLNSDSSGPVAFKKKKPASKGNIRKKTTEL